MIKKKIFISAIALTIFTIPSLADKSYKMTTNIPKEIIIANKLDTRIGKLNFFDGVPTDETTKKLRNELIYHHALDIFLDGIPAASLNAMREGLLSFGPANKTILVFEEFMDSKSLFLTPNSESIYTFAWIDLSDGPVVLESPAEMLSVVDNALFEYVADLGNAGPDKGKGGKYLFIPPEYKGDIPKGYFVYKSTTYGHWLLGRAFAKDGDKKAGADNAKTMKIYKLSEKDKPTKNKFVNASGKAFNTIHSSDINFFYEINSVVQREHTNAFSPEMLGKLANIGIIKGKEFKPDTNMKKILTDASNVGSGMARTISYKTDKKDQIFYPDSSWLSPIGDSDYHFYEKGFPSQERRSGILYIATGVTPAMGSKTVGIGSQYLLTFEDSNKKTFDGEKTYKLSLPSGIPAKDFWSIVLYDTQTRSMLQTDQKFPSVSSQNKDIVINKDGSVDIYFAPNKPEENVNWVQTIPNKSFFLILRLYGPLKPFFDKTWKPNEIKEVK